MKTATKKMRPPVKTFGGKAYLARRIVSLFPEHETYCEPFFGGGSVLLNKAPSRHEFAGDLDLGLIRFWREIKDFTSPIIGQLADTPYSEAEFIRAASDLGRAEDYFHAVAFIIRNRFSRGGMGKDFAWSERLRGGIPGDANAWRTIVESLPAIRDRVADVRFYRTPAVDLIAVTDSPTTLFYCDPPYLHATRTHRKAYDHEMTDRDHERLLEALLGCQGKVFISGYDSPLYRRMLAGWKLHTFNVPNNSGQGKVKQRRIECVWQKPAPAQLDLAFGEAS